MPFDHEPGCPCECEESEPEKGLINTDTDEVEDLFRAEVRDILNLDPFTRDQAIFDALRRLVDVAGVAQEVRS